MSQNPFGNGQDPFEEFFKKLSENGGAGFNADDMKNMGIPLDPAMLSNIMGQFSAMMSNQGEGVNWDQARQHARQVAASNEDPSVTENQKSAVKDASQLADLWLDPVVEFSRPEYSTEAWSRAEWIENSFDTWTEIAQPVAEETTAAMNSSISSQIPEEMKSMLGGINIMGNLGSMMFGMQIGSGVAHLSTEVLSTTDIGIPLVSGRSALLPDAIKKFTDGLEIPAQEVMLYLAVREAALVRLHKTVPWLREDIMALIQRFARGIHVDIERMQSQAMEIDLDSMDPERIQEAFSAEMFEPQHTEDQKLALDRLENLLALIDGWATVVTEEATKNLPSTVRMSEVMNRRRADGGPVQHLFQGLLGLKVQPRKFREATDFWRGYESEHGAAARDQLWNAPENLPTSDELEDSQAFEDRSEFLNSTDEDFDAALEKLLSGGYDAPDEEGDNKPDEKP
ncbi:zinc-dependent metalloprotease [Rothia sp. ZJ1223]|uniref:zinc-dependent metalloprotease n=1 Tax=Rothia sp. ZJ1223 TaxID=2811098 RepID=UPI001959D101|nr:zinc-dependent metalloprotease [Rothia sp. ZJ1223]MBM7051067.1 zinc-dependent metalloprotease [Rothia sp. ZJ1223]